MIPVRVPLPGPDIQVSLFKERVRGLYVPPSLEVGFRGVVYWGGVYILLFRGSIYLASSQDPTEEAEGVLYCGDGACLHSDIDTKRKRMTFVIRSAL